MADADIEGPGCVIGCGHGCVAYHRAGEGGRKYGPGSRAGCVPRVVCSRSVVGVARLLAGEDCGKCASDLASLRGDDVKWIWHSHEV